MKQTILFALFAAFFANIILGQDTLTSKVVWERNLLTEADFTENNIVIKSANENPNWTTDKQFTSFISSTINYENSKCGTKQILWFKSGSFDLGKSFQDLPSHKKARVSLKIHLIDCFEKYTQVNFLTIISESTVQYVKQNTDLIEKDTSTNSTDICGLSQNQCGDQLNKEITYEVEHTNNTILVVFGSTRYGTTEFSWGISDLKVELLDDIPINSTTQNPSNTKSYEGHVIQDGECQDSCEDGYVIENGHCVKKCSGDLINDNGVCRDRCKVNPEQYGYFNGEKWVCVDECEKGQVKHEGRCKDECPPSLVNDHSVCNPKCTKEGDVEEDGVCKSQCTAPKVENDGKCTDVCDQGEVNNRGVCSPDCDSDLYKNKDQCVEKCTGENQYYNGRECVPVCPAPKLTQGDQCVDQCLNGYVKVGTQCKQNCDEEFKDKLLTQRSRRQMRKKQLKRHMKKLGNQEQVQLPLITSILERAQD